MPIIKRESVVEVRREWTLEVTEVELDDFRAFDAQDRDDFFFDADVSMEETLVDENDVEYSFPTVWATSIEDAIVIVGNTVCFKPNSDTSFHLHSGVSRDSARKWKDIWVGNITALYEHLATTSVGDGTPEKSSDDEPIPFVPTPTSWTDQTHERPKREAVIEPLTVEQLSFYGDLGELAQVMEGMTPPERARFRNMMRTLHFGHDVDE